MSETSCSNLEDWIACPHTLRVLRKNGIETMEQLSFLSHAELLQFRGVGPAVSGNLEQILKDWKEKGRKLKP